MLYDGKPVDFTPDQEEMVTFFVRYMDTDHMKKPQFTKNFWKGFKTSLGKNQNFFLSMILLLFMIM